MESPEPVTLDLDEAEEEIRKHWFVWTAAGLTVQAAASLRNPTPSGRVRLAITVGRRAELAVWA